MHKTKEKLLLLVFSLLIPVSAHATCFWWGVGEYFVPGLGYIGTKQWDKVAVMGTLRWVSYLQYNNTRYDTVDSSDDTSEVIESGYYQDDPDKIYVTTSADDSASGKQETDIYLNEETWKANFYLSLYSNLGMMSAWDLYQDCKPNNELYSMSLAPFKITHFFDKWYFWAPMGLLAYNAQNFNKNQIVRYHLGRGLTESDLKNDSFYQYYTVGLGEEMFFRGMLQDYFFSVMKNSWSWSPGLSRHLAVWSAAAAFGVAHSGTGFMATPGTAFLMGGYLGYAYHPSLDEFDLTTAIAIHTWWDIIVAYTILNNATFEEINGAVEIPLASIAFRF